MKKLVILFAIALMTISTYAEKNPVASLEGAKKEKTVKNLLLALKSDNTGLQSSAAYYLGEMESTEAVLPLMTILNSNNNEGSRVMAALSLVKIGDERGIQLVRYYSNNDSSSYVKRMCTIFIENFENNKF